MAERVLAKGSHDFIPTHLLRLANDICLEPYGSTNHIPSILEGMWSIVDRKAGGLAVARHIGEVKNGLDRVTVVTSITIPKYSDIEKRPIIFNNCTNDL